MSESTTPDDDIEIIQLDDAAADAGAVLQPDAPTPEDATAQLKQQLVNETAAREAAEQRAAVSAQESHKFKTEAENAQYNLIGRAIEVRQSEIESAENRIVAAREAGDYKAEMTALREHGKAVAALAGLEAGKSQMDAMRASPTYQQQRQAPPANEFETQIQTLSPVSKQWARAHPDAFTDNRKFSLMLGAHHNALAAGIRADSPEYFAYIEQGLGYRQAPTPQPQPQRQANPSAPVSGQARTPNGAKVRETLTMTPRMVQLAKDAGVSKEVWAKHYLAGIKDGTQEPLN